jgi:hypothetical protein
VKNEMKRVGQSTRDLAARRYTNRVWFVLGTIATVTVLLLVANNSKSLGIGGIGLLGLFVAARFIMNYSDIKTNKMIKEERRAIRGAKGEETIGSILDGLGEEYLVIHDVVSTYGNIDHIVIGKQAGIFLLETKAHRGRVSVSNDRLLVNGHDPEKDFVAQALNNTYWLREKIRLAVGVETWITPVLVFTNAFVERSAPIKGVKLLNRKFLLKDLQAQNAKSPNPVLWENRDKIRDVLCA